MDDKRVNAALEGATDTETVGIEAGVVASVSDVFRESFGDRAAAVVVADENTLSVAGEEVRRQLEKAGIETLEPYVFPGHPHLWAEYGNVEKLVASLGGHDAVPVAVGSGTLNDLVKRASSECERPYLCVGTAASMDGYTAFGASITKDGFKQTLGCPAPKAVLADVDVLVGAPPGMTASGYADLLGKVTAGADWMVADALGIEPIDPDVWSLVQDPLRGWTDRPAGLRGGDPEAMRGLIEGLVMSGLAMQAAASSRPASGAEHLFSHLWEMEGLGQDEDPPLSHGFKVGVGSVAIAALYERILERDLGDLDFEAIKESWPSRDGLEEAVRAAHKTPSLVEAAVEQSLAKYVDADELGERLGLLREQWPGLRGRLARQLMPAGRIRDLLRAAGCPVGPSEIGLGPEDFRATYTRARMIRSRYTVLDLANETGILEGCVEELFSPGGFWARDVVTERRYHAG